MKPIEITESTDIQQMSARARSHDAGNALDRLFYTSQAVYERDLEKVWSEIWLWAGHTSQLPNKGDFFLFEFGSESIIIVRDGNHEIRAHLNVCRHRGSRVCLERGGNARLFSCPYHGWTYDLGGNLRSGRLMDKGFDRKSHHLLSVNVRVFQGFIFVCLADTPPAIDGPLNRLAPMTSPFEFENLKIAHTASYPVPANWKLALENYLECYHCASAHKEFSRSHSLKDPASMTEELVGAMQAKSREAGLPVETIEETGPSAEQIGADVYYHRYPLYPGYVTGSREGGALAPLLGELAVYDCGATDIQIGPLNNFLAYSDHVVGYRFIPKGLQQTDIQIVWLVRGDAEEGRDYKIDELTWLWDVTTRDDERIIRHNQEGVNSIHFRPGPLSTMEWGISDFYHGYLAMVG